MSKSFGNSPDPLDLIAKYGADGLRFGLMRIAPSGQDIRFDEKQIEEGRNFATKLWNAGAFPPDARPERAEPENRRERLSIYAIEVLARLNETIDAVEAGVSRISIQSSSPNISTILSGAIIATGLLKRPRLTFSARTKRKKKSALAVMDFVLSATLRLLHPFMPHLTEELWSLLGFGKDSIQFAAPPEKLALDAVADVAERRRLVSSIYETVQAGRNLRSASKLPSNKKIRFILRTNDKTISEQIPDHQPIAKCRRANARPQIQGAGWHSSSSHSVGRTFSRDRRGGPGARTRATGQGNREDW